MPSPTISMAVVGWCSLVLLLGSTGCLPGSERGRHGGGGGGGGPDPEHDGGSLANSAGESGLEPGRISIFLTADRSPRGYEDGLAGQTVRDFQLALSRYELLRGADDPEPVLCFDHGTEPWVAELSRDSLVGRCVTATIPTGSYTHGRTRVDWTRFTVAGVLHRHGSSVPGPFTIFRAFSDVTVEGQAYRAGEGHVTFPGEPAESPEFPEELLPPLPGVSYQLRGGQFTMTFPYTESLFVWQGAEDAHWARFHWQIADAFRWQDVARQDYQAGRWDVTDQVTGEEVRLFGVADYYITTSAD